MRYFENVDKLLFYKEPQNFNKYSKRELLQYAIGANMYMPGTKNDIFEKLIGNVFREVGAITLCLEDAISEEEVPIAEQNVLCLLEELFEKYKENGEELFNRLPLIFIRVRNPEQFASFSRLLTKKHLNMICGFNFPKFNSKNGRDYFKILKELSQEHNEILYGMPILEDCQLMHQETRINELYQILNILTEYDPYVLNIRVGGTDFSSMFGLRRSVNNTIYDVRVISDCLIDIVNFFLREGHQYVVSGPVWEYFSYDETSPEIQGLVHELQLDIENGFQGKTIIHPSQINPVNKQYIVNYHEYQDAIYILNSSGGVSKGSEGNRMNEVSPHKNWARKIIARANVFGVLEQNTAREKL